MTMTINYQKMGSASMCIHKEMVDEPLLEYSTINPATLRIKAIYGIWNFTHCKAIQYVFYAEKNN